MLTFFIIIIVFCIALAIWSCILFILGLTLGALALMKDREAPYKHYKQELNMSIQEVIDNPIFLKFMSDRPFVKTLVARNALSNLYFDDEVMQLVIHSPAEYEEIIHDAIQDAKEVNFTYNLKKQY